MNLKWEFFILGATTGLGAFISGILGTSGINTNVYVYPSQIG